MGAEYLKNINLRIMTYLRELENGLAPRITSPFDILVRNLFDTESSFHPLHSVKLKHPVDVYEDNDGLHLEVACTGLTKEDVNLNIEGDILRVSYTKSDESYEDREYHYSGIAKRSFSKSFTLADDMVIQSADLVNGMLTINLERIIPEEKKPRLIKVN